MQCGQFIYPTVAATKFDNPLTIPGSLRHKARHSSRWVVMQCNAVNVNAFSQGNAH
jgi:hypothetical protein